MVEGELGHLVGAQFDEGEEGGSYSKEGHYTNPEQAVEFVKRSGVDSLAVAIGNSHGAYKFKGEQHLDLERLKAIKKALMDAGLGDYPLVLHGASSVPKDLVEEINKYGGKLGTDAAGVPEADIEVARRIGCTKVNIDTDLRLAMTAGIRKVFAENPKEFDPRKYLGPARDQGQGTGPAQGPQRPLLRRPRLRLVDSQSSLIQHGVHSRHVFLPIGVT